VQEIAQSVLEHIQANWALSFGTAIAAGFLATRFVAQERRPGVIGFTIVGAIGFFLSNFMLFYLGLNEHLDALQALRIFVDLFAAFIGSFFVAGLLHVIKPT
jgi:uncharacterized membrane protein YeaQ/YmgE (transglycosylase-associated protein family)